MLKKVFYIPIDRIIYSLMILQILDGVLTAIGISIYGVEAEGNPILKSLIIDFGLLILIPAKLSVIGFLYYVTHADMIEAYKFGLFIAFVAYCYVVVEWSLILTYGY